MPDQKTLLLGPDQVLYPLNTIDLPTHRLGLKTPEPIVLVITSSGDFALLGFSESLSTGDNLWFCVYDNIEGTEVNLSKLPKKRKACRRFIRPSKARSLLLAYYKSHNTYYFSPHVLRWLLWLSLLRTRIKCADWYQASSLRSICDSYGYNLICLSKNCKTGYKALRIVRSRKSKSKVKTVWRISLNGTLVHGWNISTQGFYCTGTK